MCICSIVKYCKIGNLQRNYRYIVIIIYHYIISLWSHCIFSVHCNIPKKSPSKKKKRVYEKLLILLVAKWLSRESVDIDWFSSAAKWVNAFAPGSSFANSHEVVERVQIERKSIRVNPFVLCTLGKREIRVENTL